VRQEKGDLRNLVREDSRKETEATSINTAALGRESLSGGNWQNLSKRRHQEELGGRHEAEAQLIAKSSRKRQATKKKSATLKN